MGGSDIYKWNPPMKSAMIREECLNIRAHKIQKMLNLSHFLADLAIDVRPASKFSEQRM